MKLKAIVEMPKGSSYKYEVSKCTGKLVLDRVLNQRIPHNYGYFPDTLSSDGDPLDCFILSKYPIPPLTEVEIEVLGILKCKDNGVQDDKVYGVLVGEEKENMGALTLIQNYLESYKEGFKVEELCSAEEAMKVYEESCEAYGKRYGSFL